MASLASSEFTGTGHRQSTAQWKLCLLEHSITPIQQFAYTSGKNATDSSLIIDAMDLMYSKHLDGFCLVSSDSDFTRLAQRLREAGMVVYGFGEQKTPKPFVVACDKFIYTEVLRKDSPSGPAGSASTQTVSAPGQLPTLVPSANGGTDSAVAVPPKVPKPMESPVGLIVQAIEQGADESGWAFLGAVGNYLTKIQPDFDPRLFGCRKLSDLIRKYPDVFRDLRARFAGIAQQSPLRSNLGEEDLRQAGGLTSTAGPVDQGGELDGPHHGRRLLPAAGLNASAHPVAPDVHLCMMHTVHHAQMHAVHHAHMHNAHRVQLPGANNDLATLVFGQPKGKEGRQWSRLPQAGLRRCWGRRQ